MRKAQNVLYKIGNILNYVLLGLWILLIVLNIGNWGTMVYGIFLAIITIVLIIISLKNSKKASEENSDNMNKIILLMIFGLLCNNVLFLVGGIFGIIAISQEKNQSSKAEEQNSTNDSENENDVEVLSKENKKEEKEEYHGVEGQTLSWFRDEKNRIYIDKYLTREQYFEDDKYWKIVNEMCEDDQELQANRLLAFDTYVGRELISNKISNNNFPTILFSEFLAAYIDELEENNVLRVLSERLSEMFNIYEMCLIEDFKYVNRDFLIDDNGDVFEGVQIMTYDQIISREKNPIFKYIDEITKMFGENISNQTDEYIFNLYQLWSEGTSFIFHELIGQKTDILENNPWLFDKNTYVVMGDKLRTREQFRNKAKTLSKNTDYFNE